MRRSAWRLLLDGPGSAARNMSVDEALLAHAAQGPPTLRLYTWRRPSVSLGYRQKTAPWTERGSALGVELVRRVSGGGAVVHAGDLTYCVAAGHDCEGVPDDLDASYAWIRGLLIAGLREAGLDARPGRAQVRADRLEVCFAGSTGFEVELEGSKLIGSAQRRTAWGFLQHGSIRLADDDAVYRTVMGVEPPRRPEGPLPPRAALIKAIVRNFGRSIGRPLERGTLTTEELRSARERQDLRVRDPLCAPPVASSRFPQGADRLP